jgi:hypothetical protein
MTLDQIIAMPVHPLTKSALEECRGDKPYKWLKAWSAAASDKLVPIQAISWLNDQARREGGFKDAP